MRLTGPTTRQPFAQTSTLIKSKLRFEYDLLFFFHCFFSSMARSTSIPRTSSAPPSAKSRKHLLVSFTFDYVFVSPSRRRQTFCAFTWSLLTFKVEAGSGASCRGRCQDCRTGGRAEQDLERKAPGRADGI